MVMLTSWIRINLPLFAIWPTGEIQRKHHCHIRKPSSNKCPFDQLGTREADSVHELRLVDIHQWLIAVFKNSRYSSKEKYHAKLEGPDSATI